MKGHMKGQLKQRVNRGLERSFKACVVVFVVLQLAACASNRIVPHGTAEGYDVYRPEPYLLVTQGSRGFESEIVWLPNYTHRYRINSRSGFGISDLEFATEEGWELTEFADQSDRARVASSLLDVVERAIEPGTIALSGGVQLFRLLWDDEGYFVGLRLVPVEEAEGDGEW